MLSTVIPVWNTDPVELQEALASLRLANISQEIILVDDHSDSLVTQRELQAQSEQGCKVIVSCGHRSVSLARATGTYHASGDYVLSMDSDDTLTLTDDWRPDDLAPINLGTQNSPWTIPNNLFDWIDAPGSVQWGAILRADLARALSGPRQQREEDIQWGYRLFLTAWRDRLPIKRNSGIDYRWRSAEGRQSVTARFPVSEDYNDRKQRWKSLLDSEIQFVGLNREDADWLTWWRDRKTRTDPKVFKLPTTHPNPRVDVHVLSYLGRLDWLEQTLQSLKAEPCQTHLVCGGFPGSIGAARAFAFTLGHAEYVSFLDDDDYAAPGVMQQCIDYLDANPECVGVYTDTEHLHENSGRRDIERKGRPWKPLRQLLYTPEITHLKVMRRAQVEKHLKGEAQWPTWEEYWLCGQLVRYGYWHHLPVVGAVKRYKDPSGSSFRLSSPKLRNKAIAEVTPILMAAHRQTNQNRHFRHSRHKRPQSQQNPEVLVAAQT